MIRFVVSMTWFHSQMCRILVYDILLLKTRTRGRFLLNPGSGSSSKCRDDQQRLSMSNYLQTIRRARPHIQNGGPCVLIPLFDSARYPEVICIRRSAEWIMQTLRDPIRTVFMHRFPLFLLPCFRFLSTTPYPLLLTQNLQTSRKKCKDIPNKYTYMVYFH